jgi:hypothetical protein
MVQKVNEKSGFPRQSQQWYQFFGFSFNLITAVALGCLLHAFLRMAKRRKADFPEASGD